MSAAVHWASHKGADGLACAELLLEKGAPITRLEGGKTLLMVAQAKFVPLLLPRVDAKALDDHGLSALFHAAMRGASETIEALLPHSDTAGLASMWGGAWTRWDETDRTALMFAVESDQSGESARLLLPFCDPNQADAKKRTALTLATDDACLSAIKLLLPVSDPNHLDESGCSPLALAINGLHWEAARLLAPSSDPQAGVFHNAERKGRGNAKASKGGDPKDEVFEKDTRPWALAVKKAEREDQWNGVEILAHAIPIAIAKKWAKENPENLRKEAPSLFARLDAEALNEAIRDAGGAKPPTEGPGGAQQGAGGPAADQSSRCSRRAPRAL